MLGCTNLLDITHHLTDAFKLHREVFHLTQLYTETAKLDLSVITSNDFHISIRLPTSKVARAINPDTLIFHEAFFRHLRQIVIASSHTRASDEQLSNKTYWQLVAPRINDEFLVVEEWMSNSHLSGICQVGNVRRDGNLRRTIGIEDMNTHGLQ